MTRPSAETLLAIHDDPSADPELRQEALAAFAALVDERVGRSAAGPVVRSGSVQSEPPPCGRWLESIRIRSCWRCRRWIPTATGRFGSRWRRRSAASRQSGAAALLTADAVRSGSAGRSRGDRRDRCGQAAGRHPAADRTVEDGRLRGARPRRRRACRIEIRGRGCAA